MAKRRKNTTPETVEEVKSEEVVDSKDEISIESESSPVNEVLSDEKPSNVNDKNSETKSSRRKELVLVRGQKLMHEGDECIFIETRGSKVIVRKGIAFLLVEKESLSMP
jgi:hypothetical protein